MATPSTKEELLQQLRDRIDEVAGYRAARWLEELDAVTGQSVKDRLLRRMEEVPEELAVQWLMELDSRLCWQQYRQDHDDFCFGVGFGECVECQTSEGHEVCSNYEYCKAEHEAKWPDEKA